MGEVLGSKMGEGIGTRGWSGTYKFRFASCGTTRSEGMVDLILEGIEEERGRQTGGLKDVVAVGDGRLIRRGEGWKSMRVRQLNDTVTDRRNTSFESIGPGKSRRWRSSVHFNLFGANFKREHLPCQRFLPPCSILIGVSLGHLSHLPGHVSHSGPARAMEPAIDKHQMLARLPELERPASWKGVV